MPSDLIPAAEVARAVGVSRRSVSRNCDNGKLAGAEKVQTPRGEVWLVPREYADPARYHAAVGKPGRKPGAKGE